MSPKMRFCARSKQPRVTLCRLSLVCSRVYESRFTCGVREDVVKVAHEGLSLEVRCCKARSYSSFPSNTTSLSIPYHKDPLDPQGSPLGQKTQVLV